MSRSYRYNPDDDSEQSRPAWERGEVDRRSDDELDFGCVVATPLKRRRAGTRSRCEPAPMTPEWAVELMRARVSAVVDLLVVGGVIARHEYEDYTQIINAHICRILPLYDGERRNAKGRKAGAERFLSVAVDNVAKNIKKHVALRRKNVPTVPIGPLEGDDDGGDGAKDCEGEPFSDRCKCFRDLWFRMDLETMKLMLGDEELLALDLRLDGLSYAEVAGEVSRRLGVNVDRFHIMNVTMRGVRKAALKCGFEPAAGQKGEFLEN